MSNSEQIPLNLEHSTSYALEDYVVSAANQIAYDLAAHPEAWPSHAVAIVGPEHSGKSHLAYCWAHAIGAHIYDSKIEIADLAEKACVLVDDLDVKLESGDITETDMFHLYNWLKENQGYLLVTLKQAPNKLEIKLADLQSRLATFHVAEIQAPDDMLLTILLEKLFSDRQLIVDIKVVNYILTHIDRSFQAVHDIVYRLDQRALSRQQKVTIPLVKSCLQSVTA